MHSRQRCPKITHCKLFRLISHRKKTRHMGLPYLTIGPGGITAWHHRDHHTKNMMYLSFIFHPTRERNSRQFCFERGLVLPSFFSVPSLFSTTTTVIIYSVLLCAFKINGFCICDRRPFYIKRPPIKYMKKENIVLIHPPITPCLPRTLPVPLLLTPQLLQQ
jgi:hypothetical protein